MDKFLIKETCERLWNCLTPTDWIQIILISIALISVIIAIVAVILTEKQINKQSGEINNRYNLLFKIKTFNSIKGNSRSYWFVITNEGFPFYFIKNVEWIGDGLSISQHFKGDISNRENNEEVKENYEAFSIVIKDKNGIEMEGYIKIDWLDMENNEYSIKTQIIKLNNGQIINDIDLTYQNLI
ncbi:hypothetical protein WQ54_15680 [Bacillus sp. SA1-12]|uniref:hypothetical protein n=1 Tax=Bacillus sp. SA1-12 TaxID=1455638 RepID=UPI00062734DF|nr:hypothetical protein [Bacillus sp. SA1-12]KKI91264.1 hypothetical protein WQ54_15680 [Bacillus sp. SA1-12]